MNHVHPEEPITHEVFDDPVVELAAICPICALSALSPAAALAALSPTLLMVNPAVNPAAAMLSFLNPHDPVVNPARNPALNPVLNPALNPALHPALNPAAGALSAMNPQGLLATRANARLRGILMLLLLRAIAERQRR